MNTVKNLVERLRELKANVDMTRDAECSVPIEYSIALDKYTKYLYGNAPLLLEIIEVQQEALIDIEAHTKTPFNTGEKWFRHNNHLAESALNQINELAKGGEG